MPTEAPLEKRPLRDDFGLLFEVHPEEDGELQVLLASFDHLLSELEEALGPERWSAMEGHFRSSTHAIKPLDRNARRDVFIKTYKAVLETSDPALSTLRVKRQDAKGMTLLSVSAGIALVLTVIATVIVPNEQELGLQSMSQLLFVATAMIGLTTIIMDRRAMTQATVLRDTLITKINSTNSTTVAK
ncbi:hypothetical protein KBD71_05305 [Candidatus Woesebacteria bacterium]|nr:hypothetical protein [Candidatus Woesebacteria bacterium]